MKIRIYTLLYVDLDEKRQLQGLTRSGSKRVEIFLRNAAFFDKSLRRTNPDLGGLTILTNNAGLIQEILEGINYRDLSVETIDFGMNVPKGIPFYSAHFKIDAFRYFANRPDDEYSLLFDNDVVSLKKVPDTFWEIVNNRVPMCYHLIVNDCDRMMADCREIDSQIPVIQWTGGEFWGGINEFYKQLYNKCVESSHSYFAHLREGLYHIGDEALTSLAISKMRRDGLFIYDIRTLGILYRYWGMHEKKKLKDFDPVFAHLPADKVWIADRNLDEEFDVRRFIKRYNRHMRLFKLVKFVKNIIKK